MHSPTIALADTSGFISARASRSAVAAVLARVLRTHLRLRPRSHPPTLCMHIRLGLGMRDMDLREPALLFTCLSVSLCQTIRLYN
eukprot:909134-Pleurochrysis_carterae.AAC.3